MTAKPVDQRAAGPRETLLSRFWRGCEGAISVEFSIITPVMAALLLASVEGSSVLWVRGAVSEAATAAADLTTQVASINEEGMEAVFEASARMIEPNGGVVDGLEMQVTSVLTCPCDDNADLFCYSVIWSHRYRNDRLAPGLAEGDEYLGLPQELGIAPNSTMIVADVDYRYSPPFTFLFFDEQALNFEGQVEFRPRLSRAVMHSGAFALDEAPSCE